MEMAIAVAALLTGCIIFAVQIRINMKNLKLKDEYGKIVEAKVISWKEIPGRPNIYVIKAEYESDQQKVKRFLATRGKFAKRYEHDRDIQIVIIPGSKKIFFAEEDWKLQNTISYIALVSLATFLLEVLILFFLATVFS